MARTEPATLDIHGARWTATDAYELVPTAERYEQYEISLAAKARAAVQAGKPSQLVIDMSPHL